MRVEIGFYEEYIKVSDPLPFSLADIEKAQQRVHWETGRNVKFWPITIEFDNRTEWWEVYFIKPYEDEGAVEGMHKVQNDLPAID